MYNGKLSIDGICVHTFIRIHVDLWDSCLTRKRYHISMSAVSSFSRSVGRQFVHLFARSFAGWLWAAAAACCLACHVNVCLGTRDDRTVNLCSKLNYNKWAYTPQSTASHCTKKKNSANVLHSQSVLVACRKLCSHQHTSMPLAHSLARATLYIYMCVIE